MTSFVVEYLQRPETTKALCFQHFMCLLQTITSEQSRLTEDLNALRNPPFPEVRVLRYLP